MAIDPGYKTFTFDGENSGDYGVYITGAAVYNAPEREVEMIQIPGRNGAFALDKGRFENIEITYPAGTFDEDQGSFAEKISDFRNMLASRRGYCRLEDEYHPDEFRKAIYKSGLEVEPVPFQRAGEFEITFDCMPQRFLTSGESAIEPEYGLITNPTLFDSKPLIELEGYGTVTINNESFTVLDEPLGTTYLEKTVNGQYGLINYFPSALVNANDIITINETKLVLLLTFSEEVEDSSISVSLPGTIPATYYIDRIDSRHANINIDFSNIDFSATKTSSTTTYSENLTITVTDTNNNSGSAVITVSMKYTDNESYNRDQIELRASSTTSGIIVLVAPYWSIASIVANSSVSMSTYKLYIDCESGEAYSFIDSYYKLDRNSTVTGLLNLPVLKPGRNTVSYSYTMTNFKITPRWWKV